MFLWTYDFGYEHIDTLARPGKAVVWRAHSGYTATMLYEWDEEKNRVNLLKHGLDFTDACEIFSAPMLVLLDDRKAYGGTDG